MDGNQMTEDVKDSYASFEDWFHELEGFGLRSERAEGDIAWLRAAFDAGRSPTEARGEVVKALEWKKVGYTQVAETAACAYTIQPVSDDLGPHWEATVANRGMAWSSRDTESEIKEAVQADYEKRILSALSHPPAREAVDEIAAERRRQVEAEGWTVEHDDRHSAGEIALAAAAYAYGSQYPDEIRAAGGRPNWWPWEARWWKPSTPRRDLIKAAALIVAEIERIDRRLAALQVKP